MSYEDFERCTPSEFKAVCDCWREREERRRREGWERTRMESLCTLQPWSRKRLEARDVLRFAWDEGGPAAAEGHEELGAAELRERARAVIASRGLREKA